MSETTQTGQIIIPPVDTATNEATQGSIQRLLAQNLGKEVVAEFLVGADTVVRKAGTLYAVNTDYLVLYDDMNLVDVACDLYALRFITFYRPGTRPDVNETTDTNSGNSATDDDGRSGGSADTGSANSAGTGAGNSAADRPTTELRGVTPVTMAARTQAQAALNYAKRKARRLD